MVQQMPDYFNKRYNAYVPAMGYSADVVHGAPVSVDLGTPAVADADSIVDGTSINAGFDIVVGDAGWNGVGVGSDGEIDAPYGRCLQVVASGAATSNVTIHGWDYLGQPMSESFTLNGTNAVVGVKAFKHLRRIVAGTTSSTTVDIGTTDKLGLPYRTVKVLSEEANEETVASLGTLVTAENTDPQTATTADPRGTYDPQTTLNGSTRLSITVLTNRYVNAAGNGGLHGIAHFSS